MDKEQLGRQIRKARKEKGYTQRLLAEKAGVALVYLGEIERGSKMPSLTSFIKVVEALEVSADYILRHELTSACGVACDELVQKLQPLTPGQRKTVSDMIDAYLRNLD